MAWWSPSGWELSGHSNVERGNPDARWSRTRPKGWTQRISFVAFGKEGEEKQQRKCARGEGDGLQPGLRFCFVLVILLAGSSGEGGPGVTPSHVAPGVCSEGQAVLADDCWRGL